MRLLLSESGGAVVARRKIQGNRRTVEECSAQPHLTGWSNLQSLRAALAEQQSRVGLKSMCVFCDRAGRALSLKEVRGAGFRLLRLVRLRERPPLPVPAHLCHIASFRGAESALRGSSDGPFDGRDDCPSLRALDAQAGPQRSRARRAIAGGGGEYPAENTRNLPESSGFKPLRRAY